MDNRRITTVSQEFELALASQCTLSAAGITHGLLNPHHPVGDPRNIEREIHALYRCLYKIALLRGITLEEDE